MSASAHPWAQKLAATMTLARELRGMGLREFARSIHMNPATLHRIENGKGCDVVTLVLIHKATGIKYETLLG
jgi:transcriptional regulator with XRE-family HTH domain